MSSQSAQLPTRRDEIARALRREIVSGALQPGEVIKDAELAERLGSSVTPVREALTQLAAEGLIDMPPNRAKRVAALSRQSAVELCEAMELLSVALFTRGAQRLTRSDLLTMRDALEAYRAAGEAQDVAALFRTGRTFADVVIRAGGNEEIRQMLRLILARFERLLTICQREGLLDYGLESNQAIFAALERGDHAEAAQHYREQIRAFQNSVERLPARTWAA
jgi:DNA-binding GntR family transcriptional regulator